MKMRNIIISIVAVMLSAVAVSRVNGSPQEAYISKWAETAVSEMYRSGVPASITLAQGLLESRNGESELAVKGNNHFGIKCHGWKGESIYYDDDRKQECFRKYPHAEASFQDHSDFLRYRDRYKFLFELGTTDYKGWAYGLKKAGYATDPKYPQKLINLIETYGLDRYDSYSVAEGQNQTSVKNQGKSIPLSPNVLESPTAVDAGAKEVFSFSLSRQLYSQNGVPFIYSQEGDTYAGIAEANNLFLREILKFNDLNASYDLLPGTVVYLQAKKNKAAKGVNKYVAEGGESLWDISQRFAIKLKKLMKMNELTGNVVLREEDVVRLR